MTNPDDGSPLGDWPLRGHRVQLRPTTKEDVLALAETLAEPSVARWWPSYDAERVRRDLVDDVQGERHYVIVQDGRVVGLIQSYEEEEPEFRQAGIDLFLATDVQGKGLGPGRDRDPGRLSHRRPGPSPLDHRPRRGQPARPSPRIARSGSGPGRDARYQRMGDGTWLDALLMEMLADELVR